MDLDLLAAFHSLEDRMTRALLWTVLGTHGLRGLDCSMGTTYVLRDGCRSLISTLGASSPGCDMAYLRDSGCGHADLGSAPND